MKISAVQKGGVDKSSQAVISELEVVSIRLAAGIAGAPVTIGSATMLYKHPNTVSTILATSKGALLRYAKLNGTAIPQAPFTLTDATFVALISAFKQNVTIVYDEKIWAAPKAPATTAAIANVHFMLGDNNWDYDLCLLESSDAALGTLATSQAAWGNASAWETLKDMPNCIEAYYANAQGQKAILAGFGEPLVPTTLAALIAPTVLNSTYTFTFPVLGAAAGPAVAIPNDALQICVQDIPAKTPPAQPVSTWSWPPPLAPLPFMPTYANLGIDSNFKPIRKYNNAALLNCDDTRVAVANDTGGGVFVRVKDKFQIGSTQFIGVISDINGTNQTGGNFDIDFASLNPANLPGALATLNPYLPWPTRNQVVTLITSMLLDWPLDWPPAPVGYYPATISQQKKAEAFVEKENSVATQTNVKQALNDVFGNNGKATLSNYESRNILHASAGNPGAGTSATIFFQQNTDSSGKLMSVQIVAIGSHSNATTYSIDWVWADYTTWYAAQQVEKTKEIAAVPNPGSQQGKKKIDDINQKYEKIFGTEELQQGVTYTLQ